MSVPPQPRLGLSCSLPEPSGTLARSGQGACSYVSPKAGIVPALADPSLPDASQPELSTDQVALGRVIDGVVAKNPALQSAPWGFVLADEQGHVLYEHQADQALMPASTTKLVTGATAIAKLGADTRFTTRLVSDGQVDGQGVLHGNLYLVGGGDPTLTTQDLQQAVQSSGLKRVDGRILVDDSCFDQVRRGRGWAPDDVSAPYAAECDGLSLDHNVTGLDASSRGVVAVPNLGYLELHNLTTAGSSTQVTVERGADSNVVEVRGTVGPNHALSYVTVHEPALYAGAVFHSLLPSQADSDQEQTGMCSSGLLPETPASSQTSLLSPPSVEVGSAGTVPAHAQVLWEHTSPTVREIEHTMLKESDNLYAETLFHALAGGNSAVAPDIEKQTLQLSPETLLTDGCGLSRDNRLSPRQLVQVVQQQYKDHDALDCLPISGVDGTLKNRMQTLRGRVHAKTGTLGDVSTLAGWLTLSNGHALSFAWMANGFACPAHDVKATEDQLLQSIATTLDETTSTSGDPSKA